jgi:ABC-type multidrug transport system fused ATPase/permease subunit
VTLHIRSGSTVAVVGATGSGKSTLIGILSGLERPTSGVVRSAQPRVAAVFQEPIVLSGPISDSLTMGHPVDRHRLDVALRVASAEFIDDLPAGLQTKIGERGITLSGGQRQRVALARALADPSAVLLLDDTTSSLDAATEERVLQALADMEPNARRTVVMVAARPSSISFADEIVVLDRGTVVGQGSHAELHANNDVYRTLYDALGQP